jgi:hypothetical protein
VTANRQPSVQAPQKWPKSSSEPVAESDLEPLNRLPGSI